MELERGTVTRLSLSKLSRKFSLRSRDYAKVDDMYDTRIPLHNEDAFQHGLKFKAKFIGSLEIARPTCKLDIIAAMRRIRYEFKVKGVRKKRCQLDISTQGVKVAKRKRRRRRKQYSEDQLFVMQHPIYRIFYVSHDSQDLKIFSYITREVPDNTFRCNVFKAYRKSAALHIVRSLGQAFDVCHRLNPKTKKQKNKTSGEEKGAEGEKSKPENGAGEEGKGKEEDAAAAATAEEGTGEANATPEAAMQKLNLENGTMSKTGPSAEMDLSKDLMSLQFDPFIFGSTAPAQSGFPNGAPFGALDPFQSPFFTPGVPPPPLTVSNTSTSLPDFPDGAEGDLTRITIPPPHAHLAYRPRPRPAISPQNVIKENPFTETMGGSESPTLSIGEPLSTIPEGTEGNPFRATDERAPSMWELEKQQMMAQFALLSEQLKAETAQRIESQARVEHLLMQNKELLAHLQKLMAQLQQLHSLQLTSAASAKPSSVSPPPPASSPPPPPASQPTPPPSSSPPPPPTFPPEALSTSSPIHPPTESPQLSSPTSSPTMVAMDDPLISPASEEPDSTRPQVTSPRMITDTPTTTSSGVIDAVPDEVEDPPLEVEEDVRTSDGSEQHDTPPVSLEQTGDPSSPQFPITFEEEPIAASTSFPVTFD